MFSIHCMCLHISYYIGVKHKNVNGGEIYAGNVSALFKYGSKSFTELV